MFNFKNGAFLLGLLTGIVLTALLGIFVFMLVQVTRPTQTATPEPTAPVAPTAMVAPTVTLTNTATVTQTVTPTSTATVTLTVTPTSTATVTLTVAPTNTATVTPTSEPTAASTAVPVSAPTDFPFRNFPTPLPTPVTVPFNGGTQGMGVNLATVSLDGVPQNALQVKPEQVFDVAMDYNVWSILEPIPGGDNSGRCASTCIVNLTVGMVSSDGSYKPLFCIYQGTPGNEPGVQSSWTSSISPPTTPGVYGLRLDYHLTYNCEQALADVDPGRPGISLATIRVE